MKIIQYKIRKQLIGQLHNQLLDSLRDQLHYPTWEWEKLYDQLREPLHEQLIVQFKNNLI